MYDSKTNYIEEAKRIIDLLDKLELHNLIFRDAAFLGSMKVRVKYNSFVSEEQIFWLRDIKDKLL